MPAATQLRKRWIVIYGRLIDHYEQAISSSLMPTRNTAYRFPYCIAMLLYNAALANSKWDRANNLGLDKYPNKTTLRRNWKLNVFNILVYFLGHPSTPWKWLRVCLHSELRVSYSAQTTMVASLRIRDKNVQHAAFNCLELQLFDPFPFTPNGA